MNWKIVTLLAVFAQAACDDEEIASTVAEEIEVTSATPIDEGVTPVTGHGRDLGVRRSCKFDSVRVCDYFVDKSDIINVVFNELASTRCIFLSAAPGFGTTVNLAVIDMFANVEFNQARQLVPPKESYSYSIFKENYKISQHESLIEEHLGQYLVVPLRARSFQQNEFAPKHVAWSLNMMIGWSNRRWRWIGFNTKNFTNNNETSQRDFSFMQKVMRTKFRLNEIISALEKLVELLHRYLGKKIIILLDEYDRIFRHAIQNSMKNVDFYYSFLNRALLPLLQENDKVYKVIIAGQTSLPLYLGNCSIAPYIQKYPFLQDHIFTPFQGFDNREVEQLFNKFGLPLEDKHELENLANGYITLTEHTIKYNADLVMAYFRKRRNLKDIDVFNGTTAMKQPEDDELYFPTPFLMVPAFRYKVVELMYQLDVEFNLVEYDVSCFNKFADFSIYNYQDKEKFSLDLLFTYTFEQGYLRLTNVPNKYHLANKGALIGTWAAVQLYYDDIGKQALFDIGSYFRDILLSKNTTQIDALKEDLQSKLTAYFKLLNKDESFEQLKVPEYQFHSVILAAIVTSLELNIQDGELEAFGKSHIQFFATNTTTRGVIEIKYGESAEQALELALSSSVSDPNITEIKYFGININRNIDATMLVQLKPIQEP